MDTKSDKQRSYRDMTAQECFDHTVSRLLAQGKVATDLDGKCVYHAADGSKCAGGWNISDAEYKPEMEHKSWIDVSEKYLGSSVHAQLISELQDVHDDCSPKSWPRLFRIVAARFGLNSEVCK